MIESIRTYQAAILDGDAGLVGSDIFTDMEQEWTDTELTSSPTGRLATQRSIIHSETFWGVGIGSDVQLSPRDATAHRLAMLGSSGYVKVISKDDIINDDKRPEVE